MRKFFTLTAFTAVTTIVSKETKDAILIATASFNSKKRKCLFRLATFMLVAMTTCNFTLVAQEKPIVPNVQPCPCEDLYPGYYFTERFYNYKPVLFSNMSLDEFIGYVIMDSIITHGRQSYPNWQAQEAFIAGLTCKGDTLNYAMKHLYRMADNNPFLYFNFMRHQHPQPRKMNTMQLLPTLLNHIKKECGYPKQEIIRAEYILHLRTNKVEPFVYESKSGVNFYGDTLVDTIRLIVVYNQVVATIKGQRLPEIGNSIEVFVQDSAGVSVKKSTNLNIPSNTDFIYHYNPTWSVSSANGKMSQSMGRIPMEADREYIVFAWGLDHCVNAETALQFYRMRPTTSNFMGGIFPIVDGNVIDEANDWGWGTEVPFEEFRERLQALIDSVKNYGE